jgi:hypothetical protein
VIAKVRHLGFLSVVGAVLAVGCGAPEEGKVPQLGLDYGPEDAAVEAAAKDDSATSPGSIVGIAFAEVKKSTFTRTKRWRAFRFAGREGQKVDLYLDGLRGLDMVLYLYKISRTTGRPFGQPLASNDDTTEPGWKIRGNSTPNPLSSKVAAFLLPENRNYALVATTYRQWYDGEAEVVVKEQPARMQCAGFMAYPPCPQGMHCDISLPNACHGADLPGYCVVTPTGCPEIYAPVCGCDGKTYGNDCERKGAKVQLDHQGPCGAEGDPCSADWPCQDRLACKSGTCRPEDYCETIADCANLPHVMCVGYWSCAANQCRYSCGRPPQGGRGDACGSRGLPPCAEGLFCQFPLSADCGATDAPGTCQPRPQACTMIYAPVCGCDSRTYGSACVAAAAGISVARNGACQ